MKLALTTAAALLAASAVSAAPIALSNAGFEAPDQSPVAVGGDLDDWGPNGGFADHAGFARPNNGSLGAGFGFYTPSGEAVLQATGITITAGNIYSFSSWATGGSNGTGNVGFVLAYDNGTGDISDGISAGEYTIFATADGITDDTWQSFAGVSAVGTADALGNELLVGWGPNLAADPDDIWFDQASASVDVVPEPGSLALLGLGGLALIRRRR
ncbi:MAG: PEP-CTERM sorting domain-containing protein [Phycisphaerales bacterium JB063]